MKTPHSSGVYWWYYLSAFLTFLVLASQSSQEQRSDTWRPGSHVLTHVLVRMASLMKVVIFYNKVLYGGKACELVESTERPGRQPHYALNSGPSGNQTQDRHEAPYHNSSEGCEGDREGVPCPSCGPRLPLIGCVSPAPPGGWWEEILAPPPPAPSASSWRSSPGSSTCNTATTRQQHVTNTDSCWKETHYAYISCNAE